MEETLKFIEDQKLIGVVQARDHSDADAIAKALIDGGVKVLEVTPNVTQSIKLIEALSKRDDAVIGLGSACDGELTHRAVGAGAKFVSSHYTDKNVLTVCKNNNVPVMLGASTITEAIAAYELGADLIQIYPVNFLGEAAYVGRLKRSFPFLKLVPSSGVTLVNFFDYLKAGATASTVGKALCDKTLVRNHQWTEVTERAKQLTEKLEALRLPR